LSSLLSSAEGAWEGSSRGREISSGAEETSWGRVSSVDCAVLPDSGREGDSFPPSAQPQANAKESRHNKAKRDFFIGRTSKNVVFCLYFTIDPPVCQEGGKKGEGLASKGASKRHTA
jgi:hypothetical protein